MTWELFLGLGAIVSFIIAVTGPMLKLNTSITKLNASVDVLQAAINRLEEDNASAHKRLWTHNEQQDDLIENHTKDILQLQRTIDIAQALHPEIFTTK